MLLDYCRQQIFHEKAVEKSRSFVERILVLHSVRESSLPPSLALLCRLEPNKPPARPRPVALASPGGSRLKVGPAYEVADSHILRANCPGGGGIRLWGFVLGLAWNGQERKARVLCGGHLHGDSNVEHISGKFI